MPKKNPSFELPGRYSPADDGGLLAFLRENVGKPVSILAHELRRMDGLLLELLLIAQNRWRADGREFALLGVAPAVSADLQRLGVGPEMLSFQVAK